jgi:hypothetical protein
MRKSKLGMKAESKVYAYPFPLKPLRMKAPQLKKVKT